MINVNDIFSNITDIKQLKLDITLVDERMPILFTCLDSKDRVYLAFCCGCNPERIMWYITPTNYATIIDLLTNKITIYDSLKNNSIEKYVVTYNSTGVYCEKIPFDSLDRDYLPVFGEYMEAEENEFSEEISIFKKRIYTISYRCNITFSYHKFAEFVTKSSYATYDNSIFELEETKSTYNKKESLQYARCRV